jgi:4'-phosphopantetheinyl transferase
LRDVRWPASAEVSPPPDGTVLVCCALLGGEGRDFAQAARVLSAEERQRAGRFLTGEPRRRYVVSRLVLRRILGACLGVAPDQVRIESNMLGKPQLAGGERIDFNLAHSGDLLLVAVARAIRVGVDVERIRPLNDAQAIARRFFSPHEADWLQERQDAERDRAFFRLWTRKEAVLKATGEGISSGLDTISVLGADGTFPDTVRRRGAGVEEAVWALIELEPANGFVGALACPAQARPVELRRVCLDA